MGTVGDRTLDWFLRWVPYRMKVKVVSIQIPLQAQSKQAPTFGCLSTLLLSVVTLSLLPETAWSVHQGRLLSDDLQDARSETEI